MLYAVQERDHSTPTRTVCCENTRCPGVRIVVGGGGGGRGGCYILCSPSQVFVTTNDAYLIVWLCCLRCFYTKYNPIDDHSNISYRSRISNHWATIPAPVLHDWCNKGRGMCYPVCGIMHIKEPLHVIGKSIPCGGSRFPLSLSEWSFAICPTPYNRI